MAVFHHDDCICGACQARRRGDERRAELAERWRVYTRPRRCAAPGCEVEFQPGPRRRTTCSSACRQRLYRARLAERST